MKTNLLAAIAAFSITIFSGAAFGAMTDDGAYALDKDHTHIGFNVSHLGISRTVGRFNEFSGTFDLKSNGESKVDFTIDVASVDTNQARRDKHLRSDDFFDVESFETITFASTAVTYNEAGDPATITGGLNLHGMTNPVTFDVKTVGAGKGPQSKQRAGYTAKTKISRGAFGMDQFSGIVGDEVEITVNLEMIKK